VRAGRVTAYGAVLGCALLAGGAADAGAAATEAYPPFGLAESSGLAVSVLHDGIVWVVEDSGEPPEDRPVIRAFDPAGTEVASVTLAGWNNRDTEALAMGPGPALWVADIGDNNAARESVVVHTFAEPVELAATTLEPVSYRLRYPGGPVDAEALMVDPVDGRIYVASKSPVGDGGVFVAPEELVAGETHDLTLITNVPSWITDGSFTPDGEQLVLLRALRSLTVDALVYDVTRPGAGVPATFEQTGQIPLQRQAQPEMLAITLDGSAVLVGSEGEDEPVFSVPISSAGSPPEATTTAPDQSETIDEPGAVTQPQESSDCALSDPIGCLDEPTGWLAAAAVVIMGLMVVALARLRRSHS